MLVIDNYQLEHLFSFPPLISALNQGFTEDIVTPPREHHHYSEGSDLLLMPAWKSGGYLGVKLITVVAGNRELGIPSIQGSYLLFNAESGEPIAQLSAPILTNFRTAATSALAAKYLARKNSKRFLMVGTGSLAPFLIRAHASVRSYDEIAIWGRNSDKVDKIIETLESEFSIKKVLIGDLSSATKDADVISVATMSGNPLIYGANIQPGTHVDLVGSYRPDMREADDEMILKSKLYVDSPQAIHESGDLVIPIRNKVINIDRICGSLPDLVKARIKGRSNDEEITLYKSVGHASQDLIAAIFAYQNYGRFYLEKI
ncbi:MAG: ornithine cyclodeaminase family protein [Saprospiraceae bacterium]|nr:ornithine cyclodeaminase family protein [Saprospiraceae bacterium]